MDEVQGDAEADGGADEEELRATAANKCSKSASRQLSRDEVRRREQEALDKVEQHHLQRNREHLATYLERMRIENRIRK